MIACPRCGHPNADGARYCSNCALELTGSLSAREVRKTVTVMFMDAAGSTGIGERTDPEAMRRVMTRYFDEFRQIVELHGGVVEKYIGDALMAVFGVPVVHEDDALRAVRAAADIRDRTAELSAELERERGLSITWRTGINTGEVVAGDAGSGQRFVSGDAVNVAARLEQAAAPGEVLMGSATYQFVRDAGVAEPVPTLSAKGKSQPLAAYRLLDVAPSAASPARRLDSPMIGRQRQRRLLADAYEQATEERACHLFTILGAAGVGKSRLVGEFLSSLGGAATVLHGRCLSYGEGITYWPIAEAVRQAAALDDADDDDTIRSKMGALVVDETDRPVVTERLGALLGRFSAASVPEETFWAVRTLLESLARRSPVVLVLDDVHWAEPTLLDMIVHLADWTRDASLLLICLARQDLLETRPEWGGGKKYATTLTLEPLSETESHELIDNLLGRVELGGELGSKISAASEGNPLFVEEMLGMLIDNGQLVRANGGWATAGDLAAIAVPPTIQALLAARLDRLSLPERAVIESGAVEGKVFHRSAVAELAPDDVRESVPDQLRSLSRKDLVQPDRSDIAGDEAFRFRHLLIRDAAYGAMSKESRAELHARFAAWLKRAVADHVNEYEEILGYHLEQAYHYRQELGPLDEAGRALGAEAAEHLGSSGRRAVGRGDAVAATKLLASAIEMAPIELPERSRLVAELGWALVLGGELKRADELLAAEAERYAALGDDLGRVRIEISRLASQTSLGSLTIQGVIDEAQRLLAVAESLADEWSIERASFELARHQFFAGRAQLAEELLGAQLARYEPGQAPPSVYAMQLMSLYWGPKPVSEAVRRAEQLLQATNSRASESSFKRVIGGMKAMTGDFDTARRLIRESAEIEHELGRVFTRYSTLGQFLGPVEAHAGNEELAEQIMLEAHRAMAATGDRAFSATVAGNLADLYISQGRIDDAERFARIALDSSSIDDVEAKAQGWAAMGRVLAARGEYEAAHEIVGRAVDLAEQTDYLHRRGSVTAHLAEVHLAAGRRDEAVSAFRRASDYYEVKGAVAPAAAVRRRISEVELTGG